MIFKKIANVINIFLFMVLFVFLITNLNNLSDLNFVVNIGEEETSFQVNFYLLTGLVVAVYAILILIGLTVFGAGLNDAATNAMHRLVMFFVLNTILMFPFMYYVLKFGVIGIAIGAVITMLKALSMFEYGDDSVD